MGRMGGRFVAGAMVESHGTRAARSRLPGVRAPRKMGALALYGCLRWRQDRRATTHFWKGDGRGFHKSLAEAPVPSFLAGCDRDGGVGSLRMSSMAAGPSCHDPLLERRWAGLPQIARGSPSPIFLGRVRSTYGGRAFRLAWAGGMSAFFPR